MNSISNMYEDYFVTRLRVFNKITTALKLTSNTPIWYPMFVLSLVFGVTDVAGCDGVTIGCGTSSYIANTFIVSSTSVVFGSNGSTLPVASL